MPLIINVVCSSSNCSEINDSWVEKSHGFLSSDFYLLKLNHLLCTIRINFFVDVDGQQFHELDYSDVNR